MNGRRRRFERSQAMTEFALVAPVLLLLTFGILDFGRALFFYAAAGDAASLGSLEVPLHLRNAPTRLMKEIGYGKGYRYAHDEPGGYAAGERYFPDEMPDRRYYVPAPRGLEIKIGEALKQRRERDRQARGTGGT